MKRATLPLLLAFAVSAHAQTLSDRITVNVVEVPVYVMDNSGRAVKGLTRDDFELFVNGARQSVDTFDVIVNDAAPSSGAASAPERAALDRRRLYVLLFDVQNSDPYIMNRARATASEFVAGAAPGDTFAVAVLRRNGIEFVVPFATDRVAVQRAITTLRPSGAGDALSLATLESERTGWTSSGAFAIDPMRPEAATPFAPANVDGTVSFRDSRGAAFAAMADEQARKLEQEGQRTLRENSLRYLAALAPRLAPLSGIKHVVLLSPGIVVEGPYPDSFIRKVHESYRSAGVILDAVNYANQAPWPRPGYRPSLLNDPGRLLKDLAIDTGGTVTPNLASLRDMESVTYLLGFRAPDNAKKTNSISVRVKNAPFGAVVRHRRSYSTDPVAESTDDQLFLADVIVNDIPQTGMTVKLDAHAQGEQVTLVTNVPGVELLAHGKNGVTQLDVFFYVFDDKDVAMKWTHARVDLDLEKGRDFLAANPYTLRQRFSVPAGRYSAKTLLRVVGSDIIGFQRTDFTVSP